MSEWNDIYTGIGMLQQQDAQSARQRVYDETARAAQRENAEAEAVSRNYDAMAKTFQDSGGDFNALMPMVRDGASMKALSQVAESWSSTEDARKKGFEASMATGLMNLKQFSEAGTKALESDHGSEDWQTWARQAAALSPTPVHLGGYDPDADEFEMTERDQFGAPRPTGRISGTDVTKRIGQTMAGNVSTPDGKVVNNEYLRAFLSREAQRRSANPAAFADPSSHTYLQKNGKTLTVIPQINANPALDHHFVVVDPDQGATVQTDLEDLVRQGWTPTTREQMNTDTKYALDAAQVANQSRGIDISAGNLSLSRQRYGDEMSGRIGMKDQATVLNTAVDNLRARQNDMLKQYMPTLSAMPTAEELAAAQQKGVEAMRAKADKFDPQALRDLDEYDRNSRDYATLMDRGAGLAFGMTGGGRAEKPKQAPAAEQLPGERAGLGSVAGTGQGATRAKVDRAAPAVPSQDALKAEMQELKWAGKSKDEAARIMNEKYKRF